MNSQHLDAKVAEELSRWNTAPVGRVKRNTNRTIVEEIRHLGGEEYDILWMAVVVVLAKEEFSEQQLLLNKRDRLREWIDKRRQIRHKRDQVIGKVWDITDVKKLGKEMANTIIRNMEYKRAYDQAKGRVSQVFGVSEDHTKLPYLVLEKVARHLCNHLQEVTGTPKYGLVGRILTASGLMSDEGIGIDRQYHLAGERVRKMIKK